jgi:serine/threonine-protein kinase
MPSDPSPNSPSLSIVAIPNQWEEIVEKIRSEELPTAATFQVSSSFERNVEALRVPAKSLLGEGERYRVLERLGSGGMGDVYLTEDRDLHRKLAVKTVRGTNFSNGDSQIAKRFLREAQTTAQLPHPNIVPIYDIGVRQDGTLFYSMPALSGRTLGSIVHSLDDRTGPEKLPDLIDVFLKVCDAVSFAHHRGILHRDIKPDNIFVGDYGEVRLLDWGLARRKAPQPQELPEAEVASLKSHAAAFDPALTCLGAVLGTPNYMPPEQARIGIDEIDERSDTYALGGVLFSILTGQAPRLLKSATELITDVQEGLAIQPVSSRQKWPIPPALARICDKALNQKKENRFQSASELSAAVRQARMDHLRGATERVVLGLATGAMVFAASICGVIASVSGALEIDWTFSATFLACSFGLGVASAIEALAGGKEAGQ